MDLPFYNRLLQMTVQAEKKGAYWGLIISAISRIMIEKGRPYAIVSEIERKTREFMDEEGKERVSSKAISDGLNILARNEIVVSRDPYEFRLKDRRLRPYTFRYWTHSSLLVGYPQQYEGTKVVLFALLGKKNQKEVPEPEVSVRVLEETGMRIEKCLVFTTKEALESWPDSLERKKFEVELVDPSCFFKDYRFLYELFRQKFKDLDCRGRMIVLDVTSGTKLGTVAMFKLGMDQLIPAIYVSYEDLEFSWVIKPEEVIRLLGGLD
jgi:hypothetical protein